MKRHVEALVRDALSDVIAERPLRTPAVPVFTIAAPRHLAFGDLTCDVALVLGRQLGESPQAIGARIVERLRAPDGWLADVAVGGPGFVNFRFAPAFWRSLLIEAVDAGGDYGCSAAARGRRIRVEVAGGRAAGGAPAREPAGWDADAPAAARATVVADAIARLLADAGAVVERAGGPPGLRREHGGRTAPAGALDELIGVLGVARDGVVAQLRGTLAARGTVGAALRVLPVQPVRLTRDGEPVRAVPPLAALIDEIGPAAIRFLLLLERAGREVTLDLELAKRASTDNPLYLVRCALDRLERTCERDGDAGPDADLRRLGTREVALLRPLVAWPDVVEEARRGLEPERVACYAVELALAAHRWLNARRPDDGVAPGVAACLRRLLSRALLLCTGPVPVGTM